MLTLILRVCFAHKLPRPTPPNPSFFCVYFCSPPPAAPSFFAPSSPGVPGLFIPVYANLLVLRVSKKTHSSNIKFEKVPDLSPLPLLRRFQNLKTTHQRLINAHHSSRIIELPAIVRSGEEGDELTACEELIAVFNDLVGAAD